MPVASAPNTPANGLRRQLSSSSLAGPILLDNEYHSVERNYIALTPKEKRSTAEARSPLSVPRDSPMGNAKKNSPIPLHFISKPEQIVDEDGEKRQKRSRL